MDKDVRRALIESATIVAEEAKKVSARFSTRIPAATRVVSDSRGVAVVTDGTLAPSARPNEFGLRHPVFGNREVWRRIPFRPYMLEARDKKMDEVADAGVKALESWTRKAGYR
jgi:hypothetical protein